ncbi:DUF2087 domain-containing protein [Bradyrhizobium sp.]|uniref:DUF2087 domain-containing protein n=1 Tax=Bradyrhizobium sp. TaxID=376 RepID=UPI00351EBE69
MRVQLEGREHPPGHVELLNILARAVGYRNYQHFRAQACAAMRLSSEPAVPEPVDYRRVERIARHFDPNGRLIRWPGKASHQDECLWPLWAAFPATETFSEREVNAFLNERHLFGDHALLRRALCDANLLVRTPDCHVYRRVERRPSADAVALIRRLRIASA